MQPTRKNLSAWFLKEMANRLNPEKATTTPNLSLLEFALQHRVIRGRPFSFARHEYLRELYELNPSEYSVIVLEKAAQMGGTELFMTMAFWGAIMFGLNIIYFFPTDTSVAKFSQARIRPAIDESPFIRRQVRGVDLRRPADQVHLIQMGRAFLYFQGMFTRGQVISIPADALFFDELNEAQPARLDEARQRVAHSDHKWEGQVSFPTFPDYGIDESFKSTDMRYWLVRCGCGGGRDICLEETFPDCLKQTEARGWYIGCPACGEPVDTERGRWVPKHPDITDRRGYHFTQLFSQMIRWNEFAESWKKAMVKGKATFMNQRLGVAFAGDRQPLEEEFLRNECCDAGRGFAKSGDGCTMGVDQGDDLHVRISKGDKVVFAAHIKDQDYKDPWTEGLDQLFRQYKVKQAVIDALPNKNSARKFSRKYPGRVLLVYYNDRMTGDDVKESSEENAIVVGRTETLDSMVDTYIDRVTRLPDPQIPEVAEIIKHLTKIAKVKVENEKTGVVTYRYIKTGPDHYAHASNYDEIAKGLAGSDGFHYYTL